MTSCLNKPKDITYAEYINSWLDEANKLECDIVFWHDYIKYTPVYWQVGFIHLVRVHDGNTEMFINTNEQNHLIFIKEFK